MIMPILREPVVLVAREGEKTTICLIFLKSGKPKIINTKVVSVMGIITRSINGVPIQNDLKQYEISNQDTLALLNRIIQRIKGVAIN